MSGGHFDYNQYRISSVADDIKQILLNPEEKEWYVYSEETKARMKEAVDLLELAAVYVQRIDWLVSGDDSEESFHRRLKEELDAALLAKK